ncbi:MAG: helix-turn-helix transcriptional regulator [Eubacteriales bacterium]|nr:helix-turn-helix transcriptional regulator [Eubacteriales bacterium]
MLDLIEHIPVIPTFTLNNYIIQMYYALNNVLITAGEIALQNKEKSLPDHDNAAETPSHTSYFYETLLLKSVSDGVPIDNLASILSTAQIGMMCPGNPVRQKKDEAISLITLFTRTGIQAGINPEKAYRLSDTYIQSVEAVNTIPEIIQFIVIMYLDITHQVHELSYTQSHSGLIRECLSYLDLHFLEDIQLEQVAKELGYTKYYLSQSFKKEMGISISQYLTRKRISYSKVLLANPQISMQSISSRLFFSNPSHFSSVFRKLEGITPSQYRKENLP